MAEQAEVPQSVAENSGRGFNREVSRRNFLQGVAKGVAVVGAVGTGIIAESNSASADPTPTATKSVSPSPSPTSTPDAVRTQIAKTQATVTALEAQKELKDAQATATSLEKALKDEKTATPTSTIGPAKPSSEGGAPGGVPNKAATQEAINQAAIKELADRKAAAEAKKAAAQPTAVPAQPTPGVPSEKRTGAETKPQVPPTGGGKQEQPKPSSSEGPWGTVVGLGVGVGLSGLAAAAIANRERIGRFFSRFRRTSAQPEQQAVARVVAEEPTPEENVIDMVQDANGQWRARGAPAQQPGAPEARQPNVDNDVLPDPDAPVGGGGVTPPANGT